MFGRLLYQYFPTVDDIQSRFQSIGCSRSLAHHATTHVVDVVSGILAVVGSRCVNACNFLNEEEIFPLVGCFVKCLCSFGDE